MSQKQISTCYVRFDQNLCAGYGSCLRVCPTKAIRVKNKKAVRIVEQCIGCGECIRSCREGAVSAATEGPKVLEKDHVAIALVSPVLYAQFPGVMPKDVLLGLRHMGFEHTIDMSYFLEIFQFATEEFISRNRKTQTAPWPLISPVCPVVVRLIAFRFPNLLPNVLPVLRPVALMAREVKSRLIPEYSKNGKEVVLYYINPCPTKKEPACLPDGKQDVSSEIALGINDIYPELIKHVDQIKAADGIPFYQTRFEYETCATGNASMWGMSGGEIADMDIDKSLAVSGMEETINYLEKIELGLFQDIEYIEFRTCREGCLGGVLNAIDKYLAKGAVQKMVKRFGLGRRLHRENIMRMYEKGEFRSEKKPAKLTSLFGANKKALSIDSLQEIEKVMELIKGTDCMACGAPDCRTFAEDVVRGDAALKQCLFVDAQRRRKG
ncbi:MAG: 4Fe-4S dicluster domain-containing protein [Desulfobacterales bacterium]|nr:4Fe-4S dicluster domain-containing protein [Desulfobacterales bacterium]MDH3878051.1 4Fe-4S dicluster domain-containing protein [Desulfobacterales bacterium]